MTGCKQCTHLACSALSRIKRSQLPVPGPLNALCMLAYRVMHANKDTLATHPSSPLCSEP